MQGNYVIRKASTYDVPQIIELWKELMDFHEERDTHYRRADRSDEEFRKFITNNILDEKALVVVAEYAGNIVGYSQATMAKYPPVFERQDYGSILDLGVTKSHRRKCVGQMIVEEVKKWFQEKGVCRIEVKFLAANEVSSKFWPKVGFQTYLKTAFLEI